MSVHTPKQFNKENHTKTIDLGFLELSCVLLFVVVSLVFPIIESRFPSLKLKNIQTLANFNVFVSQHLKCIDD